jgi:hypothetical protein
MVTLSKFPENCLSTNELVTVRVRNVGYNNGIGIPEDRGALRKS